VVVVAARHLQVVVLDVNETLFPLRPIARRLAELGSEDRLDRWFDRILRDGIAASAAGTFVTFEALADHHLREVLHEQGLPVTDRAVASVLAGFDEVVPHPDVAAGLERLQRAGVPAVALTNGSADLVRSFLARGGLDHLVDDVTDASAVGRWKPAPEPYRDLLQRRGVDPADAAMVAVHPWDLFGARRAGLRTGWLDRTGSGRFPQPFGAPDRQAARLDDLVELLLAAPARAAATAPRTGPEPPRAPDVVVTAAPAAAKPLVRRLLELNAHDLSTHDGAELGPCGEFGYRYLDHYWVDDDRHPLLLTVDDHVAGLALVRAGDPHEMAEFFVLRRHRRRGVGANAARQVLRRFPGAWTVHELPGNDPAVAFWRLAIPVAFEETVDHTGTTQRFHVPPTPDPPAGDPRS
jgi:2-haloalkanoic acid dehalogenase type II